MEEPRTNTHHIALPRQRSLVPDINNRRHVRCSHRPHVPAERSLNIIRIRRYTCRTAVERIPVRHEIQITDCGSDGAALRPIVDVVDAFEG